MKKTINTTGSRRNGETLEQGIERIREVFRGAERYDVRVEAIDGGDRCANTIEGGVNGYMFTLQRGEVVHGVPAPILEVLGNAGIAFGVVGESAKAGGEGQ